MLFLKRVAVSNHDPSFSSKKRLLKGLVGKGAEFDLLFKMPKTAAVVFNAFKVVGLELEGSFKVLFGFNVFHPLEVASGNEL